MIIFGHCSTRLPVLVRRSFQIWAYLIDSGVLLAFEAFEEKV